MGKDQGWIRARDLLAGEDAVKAAGAKYLPRLEAQTDDEYEAYKSRACFFNGCSCLSNPQIVEGQHDMDIVRQECSH